MILQHPEIDPIALGFEIFGRQIDIRWYALSYLVGFILGWRYIIHLTKKWDLNRVFTATHIDDFLVWSVIGVILGGRFGYVLFYNLPHYIDNPKEALLIWQGGMSFHGGLLGMIIAMFGFARLKSLSFLRLTDFVACAAPIGLFFGRIANFVNGELIGRPTGADWGMVFSFVDDQPRHPSQLYEAGLEGFVLFWILFLCARSKVMQKTPGLMAAIFLGGYGVARFMVEYTRAPDPQLGLFFELFSMGQLLSAIMIVLSFLLAYYLKRRS